MMTLHLGALVIAAGHPDGHCLIINTLNGQVIRTDVASLKVFIRSLIKGI